MKRDLMIYICSFKENMEMTERAQLVASLFVKLFPSFPKSVHWWTLKAQTFRDHWLGMQ